MTVDALIARGGHSRPHRPLTTVFFDEAGMIDTERLERLTAAGRAVGREARGDRRRRQLPSIGAGGMFDQIAKHRPERQLENIHRTHDPANSNAWADLRDGRSEHAMAYYLRQGQLHMADTRDQAGEPPSSAGPNSPSTPIEQVAILTDASNHELHRLNARAQHHRAERGELGDIEVQVPGVPYGVRAGDRVAIIDQHHQPGASASRTAPAAKSSTSPTTGEVLIQFDATASGAPSPARSSRSCGSATPATSTAPKAPPSPARSS